MYKHQGSFKNYHKIQSSSPEKPQLETPSGKVYEVTHVVAFVWEKLDGHTSLDTVNQEIKKITKDQEQDLSQFSKVIVDELLKVNLLKEIPEMTNINY